MSMQVIGDGFISYAGDLQRRLLIMLAHAGIDITRVMSNVGSRVREHDEILASIFK